MRLKVDVIVSAGTQASLAAKRATSAVPIVLAHVGDPVGIGLVTSLARPGGNITGVSVVGVDVSGKRLALLKEAVPRISRVAVLSNSNSPGVQRSFRETEAAARALGVAVHPVELRDLDSLESVLATITPERADALVVIQQQFLFSDRTRVVERIAKSRVPAMYTYREWAESGGLIAYGPDLREVYRQVAPLADRIVKGAKPADLPVEQVTKLELVVNLRTAKALGLTIPSALLLQADHVIQ